MSDDTKGIEPGELTPKERQQWEDTTAMMAWTCPGFRHLLYKLLNNNNGKHVAVFTRDKQVCPNAATDAKNIIINPDWFFNLSLAERTYVMGHELLHNVFGDVELLHRCSMSGKVPMHDGTSLPFDNGTMQKSMDFRNNALLDKSKIGKAPKEGNFDKEVTGEESVLDIYKKVYEKDQPSPDAGDQPGDGQGNGSGFDNIMKPGKSTGQNPQQAAQRNHQQWQVELAAAHTLEQMRAQGKMAAALKRMFEKLLEPEVDWKEHIKTLLNRVGNSGGWNWKQPDEWWMPHDFFAPRRTGHGAGWLVLWGDTSGSRSDGEVASNLAEIAGMIEDVNPARITVIWCDAEPSYIDEITDPSDLGTIQARGTGGGGGTSMHPVFDWIHENSAGEQPDCFIGFTDGYVDFPEKPPYPVIWASSTDKAYPYGSVVRVMKRAQA